MMDPTARQVIILGDYVGKICKIAFPPLLPRLRSDEKMRKYDFDD